MGVYKIYSGYSNVCLNVEGDYTFGYANNSNVNLWSDKENVEVYYEKGNRPFEQRWRVDSLGNGVRIKSFFDPMYSLNAYRSGTNWNCDLHRTLYNETDSLINIIPVGELAEGLYMIQLANYSDYYLTVNNSVEGGSVYWSKDPDGIYQMWRFEEYSNNLMVDPDDKISHPLDSYIYVSQKYYEKLNPNDPEHLGVDFYANVGTPVKAVKDGTVIRTWANDVSMGNAIFIEHDTGMSLYMHLRDTPSLARDQFVSQGTQIGCVGNTGNSSGPHLHLGYKIGLDFAESSSPYNHGTWKNPTDYIE